MIDAERNLLEIDKFLVAVVNAMLTTEVSGCCIVVYSLRVMHSALSTTCANRSNTGLKTFAIYQCERADRMALLPLLLQPMDVTS